MFHKAPNTQSTVISKSVSRNGGEVIIEGLSPMIKRPSMRNQKVECDTLILDELSKSDTMPNNFIGNEHSTLEHEAAVSKISEEELFYLMSRGLSEEQAQETIILGFLEPFTKELPMEYAVELNQLMKMEMEGSVG